MSFPNEYLHRTATRESPCFVCRKFSSAVLATADNSDWFYVCISHITDPGFATCLNPPSAATSTISPVVTATQTHVQPPPSPNKKEGGGDSQSTPPQPNADAAKRKVEEQSVPAAADGKQQREQEQQSTPAGPRRYRLDRKIFYLRDAEQRKRSQQKVAREVSSKLPSVPRRGF